MLTATFAFLLIFAFARCNENPSVVIIGAGPSGIAAATKLLKSNFHNITILEAEHRIGGRVNSVKFGDAYVDLGAEWCHGEKDNIVYSMVKDLDILKHTNIDLRLIFSNGKYVDKEVQRDILKTAHSFDASKLSSEVEGNCTDINSVGECFEHLINASLLQKYAHDEEKYPIVLGSADWIEAYLESYDSPFDWNDLLIKSKYKKCEGDLLLNWNGLGYKTILDVMMEKFPDKEKSLPIDDKILLNKEVVNITDWEDGKQTTVTCQDGTSYTADHVLVTTSVGVLKANHESWFHPALPEEKIEAIRSIGFGAIVKVVLHFPERWWNEDITWMCIWSPEEKKNLIQNGRGWLTNLIGLAPAENNPKVLVAWYAGSNIPKIENLPKEELLEGNVYFIKKFLGEHYNVTEPDDFIRTTWYSNPHFRGTYSYESVKGYKNNKEVHFPDILAAPLNRTNGRPSLLFAGEATHPYYFSTVHGAIETGYREADRLITSYK